MQLRGGNYEIQEELQQGLDCERHIEEEKEKQVKQAKLREILGEII